MSSPSIAADDFISAVHESWQRTGGQGKLSALGLVVFALFSWYLVNGRATKVPYPPGPKGHPLLGMALLMPDERPWVKFAEWAKTYGPIIYIRAGWRRIVVVNSPYVAREMLDKRPKIYSSRPRSLPGEIVTRNMRSVLLPYGDHLKRVRKLYFQFISAKKCDGYLPIQAKEAIASIKTISLRSEDYAESIHRYSLSVARSVAFGRRVEDYNDGFAKDVKKLMAQFSEIMTPGKYIIDDLPFLQYLPRFLRPWMDHLEAYRDWETEFFLREYRRALADANAHPDRPSLARDIAEEMAATGQNNEIQAAMTCMEILGTGSETTAGSIIALIHGCLAFPEVVKKAHEELDRVIGRGRFPTWEDEANLPYIRAMIKEQHRWRTIAPSSFLHVASESDVIDGYRIPKGAVVYINTWAMHMDPTRYNEPEKFVPERFLNYPLSATAYANSGNVNGRDHFSYGSGRRICVGIHLAERSLFNMASRLLHTFDILPALDEKGNEIPVNINAYTSELVSTPLPFKARFVVRNQEIQETLDREWAELFGKGRVESWIS